jgi:hypothetical protein
MNDRQSSFVLRLGREAIVAKARKQTLIDIVPIRTADYVAARESEGVQAHDGSFEENHRPG